MGRRHRRKASTVARRSLPKPSQVKAKKGKAGKSLADLKKDLDTIFSVYIRIRDNGVCITCGSKTFWKYQQNGHYVSRAVLSLRFDEKNCNCQCMACNVFRHGNMDEYALALQKKYGKDILERLHKEKNKIVKLTPQWYEEKIKYYTTWVEKNGGNAFSL